jgi:CheY-like chemotaxis protein
MQQAGIYILMAEDDNDDRQLTREVFQECGFDIPVQFVASDTQVISFLETCRVRSTPLPALIILDLHLPATGGIALLKRIKSNETFAGLPVVVISETAFSKDISLCYRFGACSFIQKPFRGRHTKEKIQSFLNYWFSTVELPNAAEISAR